MDKNKNDLNLDDIDIEGKYDMVKLKDTCREVFELETIELNREYDERMPLLKNVYRTKKRTLKRS